MNITVFTIFPEIINDFCSKSLLGKALEKKLWNLKTVNIRDYSQNKHKKVDDTPYGGEQGLIMRPDVLGNAIDANCDKKTKIIYLSPRGKVFNQEKIKELVKYNNLAFICGRYEGIDERVIEEYDIEEISIGDFVLMGGELPALVVIEGVIRCIDGVVGDKDSLKFESFGGLENNWMFNNLLEYPLYTKPQVWKNREVPEVLISGNHEKIKEWKIKKAEEITKNRRSDLWQKYINNKESKNEREN